MISLGIDKRCADVLTIDAKSYCMKGHDGKIVKKGQTLRGRNAEAFLSTLKDQYINAIFDRQPERCVEIYNGIRQKIESMSLTSEEIQQKGTLNMSIDEYQRKVRNGELEGAKKYNRSAIYELAITSETLRYGKGDQLRYYVMDPGVETVEVRKKLVTRRRKIGKWESCGLIENYANDYDVLHYIERLDAATRILILVYGLDKFKNMFPNIKIGKKDTDKLDKRETKLRAVKQLIDGDLA